MRGKKEYLMEQMYIQVGMELCDLRAMWILSRDLMLLEAYGVGFGV